MNSKTENGVVPVSVCGFGDIERNKEVVYCAHSGETAKYSFNIVEFVYEKGYLALDPFLAFPYSLGCRLAKDNKQQCIEDTISLMLHCDRMWIFGVGSEDFFRKGGVQKEYEAWMKKKGTPVKFVTWQEVGISKYIPGSKWHD